MNHEGGPVPRIEEADLKPDLRDKVLTKAREHLGSLKQDSQQKVAQAVEGQGQRQDEGNRQAGREQVSYGHTYAQTLFSKGLEAAGKGEGDEAKQQFEKAKELLLETIKTNPDPLSYHLLGNVFMNLQKFEEAEEAYSKAIEKNADLAGSYMGRGSARQILHREAEGAKDFQMAASIYTKEIDAKKQRGNAAELGTLYLRRGDAYQSAGDFRHSAADFTAYLAQNPQGAERADVLYNRGVALFNLKQFDQAQNDFAVLTKENPADTVALNWMGLCALGLRQFSAAIGYFRQVRELDPTRADAKENLAFAYNDALTELLNAERYDEAYRLAQEFSHAYPGDEKARHLLCLAGWRNGKMDEANGIATEDLKKNQDDPLYILVHSTDLLRKGAVEEAVRQLEQLAEKQPNNIDVELALARAYERRNGNGDREKAVGLYTKSLSGGFNMQKWQHSVEAADCALGLLPGHPAIRFDRAVALMSLGKKEEAGTEMTALEEAILHAREAKDEEFLKKSPLTMLGSVYYEHAEMLGKAGDVSRAFEKYTHAEKEGNATVSKNAQAKRAFIMATMEREEMFNPEEAYAISRRVCFPVMSDGGRQDQPLNDFHVCALAVSCGAMGKRERRLAKDFHDQGNLEQATVHEQQAETHFQEGIRWIRRAIELAPQGKQEFYKHILMTLEARRAYTEDDVKPNIAPTALAVNSSSNTLRSYGKTDREEMPTSIAA